MKKQCYNLLFLMVSLFLKASYLCAQNTEIRYLSGKGTDDAVMWDFYCTVEGTAGNGLKFLSRRIGNFMGSDSSRMGTIRSA